MPTSQSMSAPVWDSAGRWGLHPGAGADFAASTLTGHTHQSPQLPFLPLISTPVLTQQELPPLTPFHRTEDSQEPVAVSHPLGLL